MGLLVIFPFGLTVGIHPSREQNETEIHYCHCTDEGNETKRVSGEPRGKRRVCVTGLQKHFKFHLSVLGLSYIPGYGLFSWPQRTNGTCM